MAATRFMSRLEIRLHEGENSAAVDLFDPDHARKVLVAFGRAFGRLPEKPSDMLKDQNDFLTESVNGLTEDGKIMSVRLALFAEMMKGKPWTRATLDEVGGMEGVGLTFLEETFGTRTAPPEHRLHRKAAQAVLKALLPETGMDIKGQMRSRHELLEASGYSSRPGDFDDLIRILDRELRLITPTDSEGSSSEAQPATSRQFYQLSHDYLVHSLRDWLTRKQKETRRGRAELVLEDRYALWKQKRDKRHLPSLLETLAIVSHIGFASLQSDKRRMVKAAIVDGLFYATYYALLSLIGVVAIGYLVALFRRLGLVPFAFDSTIMSAAHTLEIWSLYVFSAALFAFLFALVIYGLYVSYKYITAHRGRGRNSLKT
jgi:hypothetical protein